MSRPCPGPRRGCPCRAGDRHQGNQTQQSGPGCPDQCASSHGESSPRPVGADGNPSGAGHVITTTTDRHAATWDAPSTEQPHTTFHRASSAPMSQTGAAISADPPQERYESTRRTDRPQRAPDPQPPAGAHRHDRGRRGRRPSGTTGGVDWDWCLHIRLTEQQSRSGIANRHGGRSGPSIAGRGPWRPGPAFAANGPARPNCCSLCKPTLLSPDWYERPAWVRALAGCQAVR